MFSGTKCGFCLPICRFMRLTCWLTWWCSSLRRVSASWMFIVFSWVSSLIVRWVWVGWYFDECPCVLVFGSASPIRRHSFSAPLAIIWAVWCLILPPLTLFSTSAFTRSFCESALMIFCLVLANQISGPTHTWNPQSYTLKSCCYSWQRHPSCLSW